MRLTVNENLFNAQISGTIMELLNELKIEQSKIAVEVNLSIVKKADYSTFRLKDGNKVEIVNFVGGG
jgi:sulfur carrier protein